VEQIWLRHHRGNGRKYGNDCEISSDTLLDRHSTVGDSTEAYGSKIISSLIQDDALIINSTVRHSTIAGQSRLYNATVEEVDLENVRVFNAKLIGPWSLNEHVRFDRGTWTQPPRYHVIEDSLIRVIISECVSDLMHVGCYCRPWETWRARGRAYGKVAGWSPGLIDEALVKMAEWRQGSGNAALSLPRTLGRVHAESGD